MEDVYRASLVGGLFGAEAMLRLDSRLANMWGEGDPTKATNLIEVWASTVAVTLLINQPNQDAVTHGVSAGLATMVFESDESVAVAEMQAYQAQRMADRQNLGRESLYTYSLIYLRNLRALGEPIDFTRFPIPITNLEQLIEDGGVAAIDTGPPETVIAMAGVLMGSFKAAKKVLDELR